MLSRIHALTTTALRAFVQLNLVCDRSNNTAAGNMMLTKSLTAATAAVSCAAAKRVCQLHHGYRAAATTQHNTAYLGGSIVGSPAVASPSITRRLYSSRLIVACSSDSKHLFVQWYDSVFACWANHHSASIREAPTDYGTHCQLMQDAVAYMQAPLLSWRLRLKA